MNTGVTLVKRCFRPAESTVEGNVVLQLKGVSPGSTWLIAAGSNPDLAGTDVVQRLLQVNVGIVPTGTVVGANGVFINVCSRCRKCAEWVTRTRRNRVRRRSF